MRKVAKSPTITKHGQVCWSVFDILFSESRRKAADTWKRYLDSQKRRTGHVDEVRNG